MHYFSFPMNLKGVQLQFAKILIPNKIKKKLIQIIKYNFFYEKYFIFYILYFINRKLKILTKQRIKTIVKFLFYINKKLNILTKQKS